MAEAASLYHPRFGVKVYHLQHVPDLLLDGIPDAKPILMAQSSLLAFVLEKVWPRIREFLLAEAAPGTFLVPILIEPVHVSASLAIYDGDKVLWIDAVKADVEHVEKQYAEPE